jgi:hypothetical protein
VAVSFIVGRKIHGENNQPVSDKLYQTQLYLVHVTMNGNKYQKKLLFWSLTDKKLSSQCNFPAQIEQVQDKMIYVTSIFWHYIAY